MSLKKKRYCFDIDGVIFEISENYKDYIVIESTKKFIKKLREENCEVILYTARKMETFKGNIGKVNQSIVEETLKALRLNDIQYDEIYFGKPSADIYVDDKALNFFDLETTMSNQPEKFSQVNLGIISYRLDEIERSLEKNMEKISDKIDALIERHNSNEVAQQELKVKVERLEREVTELRNTDKKVKEDLATVRVSIAEKMGYGVAGGGLITLLAKLIESLGN